jgi:hypothetical protein
MYTCRSAAGTLSAPAATALPNCYACVTRQPGLSHIVCSRSLECDSRGSADGPLLAQGAVLIPYG